MVLAAGGGKTERTQPLMVTAPASNSYCLPKAQANASQLAWLSNTSPVLHCSRHVTGNHSVCINGIYSNQTLVALEKAALHLQAARSLSSQQHTLSRNAELTHHMALLV